MSTYDVGGTVARYYLSMENMKDATEALRRAVEHADRASAAAIDRETFNLRHRRLVAEGRIGAARQLKEDFEDAQRVKGNT